jgi:hypothetical protein
LINGISELSEYLGVPCSPSPILVQSSFKG